MHVHVAASVCACACVRAYSDSQIILLLKILKLDSFFQQHQLLFATQTNCIRTHQGQHYRHDVACLEQEFNYAPRVWFNSEGDSLVAVKTILPIQMLLYYLDKIKVYQIDKCFLVTGMVQCDVFDQPNVADLPDVADQPSKVADRPDKCFPLTCMVQCGGDLIQRGICYDRTNFLKIIFQNRFPTFSLLALLFSLFFFLSPQHTLLLLLKAT